MMDLRMRFCRAGMVPESVLWLLSGGSDLCLLRVNAGKGLGFFTFHGVRDPCYYVNSDDGFRVIDEAFNCYCVERLDLKGEDTTGHGSDALKLSSTTDSTSYSKNRIPPNNIPSCFL